MDTLSKKSIFFVSEDGDKTSLSSPSGQWHLRPGSGMIRRYSSISDEFENLALRAGGFAWILS